MLMLRIVGWAIDKALAAHVRYKDLKTNKLLGGGNKWIHYPCTIAGIKNIIAEEPISIGVGSTIYTTAAKLIIKKHFISGPNLTIITGDHMPVIGRFLDSVTAEEKRRNDINHKYDQDIVIEEDVWCGANVVILKGVTIGRGSIIAAGSVVTKDIPRYCIAGGIPAKLLKKRMTDEEISVHEFTLYK